FQFDISSYVLPTTSAPQNYDFEAGNLTGWTTSGTSIGVSTGSYNGSKYAFTQNNTGSYLMSSSFTVPTEAQTLSWWWKTAFTDQSYVYVVDSNNGAILRTLVNNGGTNGAWQQWTTDIQDYRGQSIRLKFLSNHSANYIDTDDV